MISAPYHNRTTKDGSFVGTVADGIYFGCVRAGLSGRCLRFVLDGGGITQRKILILHKGTVCNTIMNLFPYINSHLMVVPYRHIASLADLAKDERLEMFKQADLSERVLNRAMKPDGFNVGMNLGRVAGAGIADHLHLHIVPRWNGDTNFMPVLGETRVISEALSETYLELKPILKEMGET